MNTIYTSNNEGGLKIGFNLGGLAQYRLDNKMSVIANVKLSSKGQQYSKIIDDQNHSGMSFGLVRAMVKAFCDRGEEFANFCK